MTRPDVRIRRAPRALPRDFRRLKVLLTQIGVSVPPHPRKLTMGETYCIGTIRRMLKLHGQEPTVLAIRCIIETRDGNPGMLRNEILIAITRLLARNPRWLNAGLILFDAFDQIDLGEALALAHRMKATTSNGSKTHILIGLLAAKLVQHLGAGHD